MYYHLFINLFVNFEKNCYLKNSRNAKINLSVIIKKVKIELRKYQLLLHLKTIYISINNATDLTTNEWKSLLQFLLPLTKNLIEYNIEIHTNDNQKLYQLWQHYGVNRLVWRIMTFSKKLLLLNKCCYGFNYKEAIWQAKNEGFINQAIDLHYNFRNFSEVYFINDLNILKQLRMGHVSYYDAGANNNLNYWQLLVKLEEYGYFPYEKNNFINKTGIQSKHQNSYWKLCNYLGLGIEASSFYKHQSQINYQKRNFFHKKLLTQNLTPAQYYAQVFVMGLSLKTGVDLIKNQLAYQHFKELIKQLITEKKLVIKDYFLICNPKEWVNLDEILEHFI